jgi:hypothetical protein
MNQPSYTIVTICSRFPTEPYYTLAEWGKSTEGKNRLVVEAVDTVYQSLCDKPKFVYRLIKRGQINTKYIIFTDCYDLVLATTPEEIITRFLEFDADMVIGTERNCFPDDLKKEYDELPATSSFKYLNSGMIVAYTDKFLECLEAMKVEEIPNDYWDDEKKCNVHFNDQFEFMKIALKQPIKIALDYEQKLCCNLHQVSLDDLDFSEPRIKVKETGSYSCAWHLNGSAKTDGLREPILKHLNLL